MIQISFPRKNTQTKGHQAEKGDPGKTSFHRVSRRKGRRKGKRRKLQISNSYKLIHRSSQQNINKSNTAMYKTDYTSGLYSFSRSAITKYHRLVAQTSEIYFLTILEAGSLRSCCQHSWFLLSPLSLACCVLKCHPLVLPVSQSLLLIRTLIILDQSLF